MKSQSIVKLITLLALSAYCCAEEYHSCWANECNFDIPDELNDQIAKEYFWDELKNSDCKFGTNGDMKLISIFELYTDDNSSHEQLALVMSMIRSKSLYFSMFENAILQSYK